MNAHVLLVTWEFIVKVRFSSHHTIFYNTIKDDFICIICSPIFDWFIFFFLFVDIIYQTLYKRVSYSISARSQCEPSPCRNGGTCYDVGGSFECVCQTGYKGLHCEGSLTLVCFLTYHANLSKLEMFWAVVTSDHFDPIYDKYELRVKKRTKNIWSYIW